MTGGSQGLGLETARILVQKGANVTIVARGVDKLKEAAAELEVRDTFPPAHTNADRVAIFRNRSNAPSRRYTGSHTPSHPRKSQSRLSMRLLRYMEGAAPTRSSCVPARPLLASS